MINRKSSYDEFWTNKTAEIYVIYDLDTCEILEVFNNQRDCLERYQNFYDGFVNIAWSKFDIIDLLRKDRVKQ